MADNFRYGEKEVVFSPRGQMFLRLLAVTFFASLFVQPIFPRSFDLSHKAFDTLLKTYVRNGRVDYAALKADSRKLALYLQSLSSVSLQEFESLSEKDQIAFLINAYNAFTLDLILRHYPVKSIGDIGGPIRMVNLARGTPWKKYTFDLLGEKRNLDWIEHGKLRKDYNEPRIHFAINCASIGCPHLRSEAYTGSQLESQLRSATLDFLRDREKNYYDPKSNTLYLSKIFEWFEEDFIRNSGSILEFLKKQDPNFGNWKGNPKIRYTDYDWNLNGI